MKILLIDNFDSFTYNLVQYFGELGAEVKVVRNNALSFDDVRRYDPNGIVISPGPGRPEAAGVTVPLIREFAGKLPILGVCLGHQAIARAFGGNIVQAPEFKHGKTSKIFHEGKGVFENLPNPFIATRYHSLMVETESLPACLKITARSEDGFIMALEHQDLPVIGLQFHPESILTEKGIFLLENFLNQYVAAPKASVNTANMAENREAKMMRTAIQKVLARENLTRDEAFATMECIMSGQATPAQIGAFLMGLRMKGERPEEIAGFATSMRGKATKIRTRHKNAIDLCGTGGDGKNSFNISTVASFVVAGAGVPVAKHGNRSVSSKSGSADVLKALGVNIDLEAEQISQCLDDVGMAFLFAPKLHGAMKHAIGPRREMGVRTVFNILGPITNPAGVKRQLIGVYDRSLLRLLAEVLLQLDAEHVMLVHSEDGMDEISLAGKTFVAELVDNEIREYTVDAGDIGLPACANGISGGDAGLNAQIAEQILNGKKGPARDVVIANAAAALYISGMSSTLAEGAILASESIDRGAALEKLQALRKFTGARGGH